MARTKKAPEQEAPEQEAPEQEAPEQEAPEQEAPEQEAPEQEFDLKKRYTVIGNGKSYLKDGVEYMVNGSMANILIKKGVVKIK